MSDNIFNSIFPDDTDPIDENLPGSTSDSEATGTPAESGAAESASEIAADAAEAAQIGVEAVTETAEAAAEAVGDSAETVTDQAAETITGAGAEIAETAGEVVEEATGAVTQAAEAAAETASEVAAETAETAVQTAEEATAEDQPSPLERLFGAAASLVDAVIPDGKPEEPAGSAAPAEEVPPVSARANLAPAEIRSRAPEGVLSPEPLSEVETVKDARQWDDDISPELAALLFGSQKAAAPAETAAEATAAQAAAPEAAAAPAPQPGQPPAAAVLPAAPILAALAPATPIELTRVEDARSLHLYAGGHSAPSPDQPLVGKVRYSRVEEPLKNDRGQRVVERWQYYKPDYPGLGGRLVREVRSEEIAYSDGSWHWRYERRYVDRGRDKREVRAAKDRKYIERRDEVSVIEAATDKRTTYKTAARLIFAPPAEEKRGGFFSALLGKEDDAAVLSPVWREATTKEARAARKSGGNAF